MAYTKTVWEDLPSEDTPVIATALQNMENGIDFAINTISPTAGSNGDYYTTLSNVTLTTGQCIKVLFPEPTDGTKDARFSIDGGNTYKNIVGGANNQLLANRMQNTAQKLFYNGTSWLCESNLVGIAVVTTATRPVIISNLNIVKDGGIYDFVFHGKTVTGDDGITLTVNSVTTGYYFGRFIGAGTMTTSGDLPTSKSDYIHNTNIFQPGASNHNENSIITGTISLVGNRITMNSLGGIVFNARQEFYSMLGTNSNDITNITSLTFSSYTRNFAVGTTIKIYKRGL